MTIDAAGHSRVFNIRSGAVTLGGLTMRRGQAADGADNFNGDGTAGADGGGIYNAGNLTLVDCAVQLCHAGRGGSGGDGEPGPDGIGYAMNGSPPGSGGGGGNGGRGANGGNGGGIYNTGTLTLLRCTLNANNAGWGGARAAWGATVGREPTTHIPMAAPGGRLAAEATPAMAAAAALSPGVARGRW